MVLSFGFGVMQELTAILPTTLEMDQDQDQDQVQVQVQAVIMEDQMEGEVVQDLLLQEQMTQAQR
jgi:hypothetical protein